MSIAGLDVIAKARRIRKMLDGGMRQVGSLNTADIYVLDNHIHRLVADHHNAQSMEYSLFSIEDITLCGCLQSNVLFN